jgi:hypothetical protein
MFAGATKAEESKALEMSNVIAQTSTSYKRQTVVCSLYGKRCCLLPCLHKATAALRPWHRSPLTRFADAERLTITAEYVEAETGKGADALERRPDRPVANG